MQADEAVEAARIEDFGDGIGDAVGNAASQMIVDFENATQTIRNLFEQLAKDILDFLIFDDLAQDIGTTIKGLLQDVPALVGPPADLATAQVTQGPLPGLGGGLEDSASATVLQSAGTQMNTAAITLQAAGPQWAAVAAGLQTAANTLLLARAGTAGAGVPPGFARGGIATLASGAVMNRGHSANLHTNSIINQPTLMGNYMVGEGGRSEAVMPLERMSEGGLGVFARVNDGTGMRSTIVPIDRLSNGMLGVNIDMPRGGGSMPNAMGAGRGTTNNNNTTNNYYNVTVNGGGSSRDKNAARRTGNQLMREIARSTR